VIDDTRELPFDPLKVMIIMIFLVVLTYVLIPSNPFFSYRNRDGALYMLISSTNGLRLMLIPMILGFLIYFTSTWALDDVIVSLWTACSFFFIAFPIIPLWEYYGWRESLYIEQMFVHGSDSVWWPVIHGIGLVILITVKREAELLELGIETTSMKTEVFALAFGGAVFSWYSVVQVARPAGVYFYPTPFTALMMVSGMLVCIFTVIIPMVGMSMSRWKNSGRFEMKRDLSTPEIEDRTCTTVNLSAYDL